MLVAMFWTRLESPTDEYDSGTIEEINVHSCDEYDMCKHGTIDYEVVER